MRADPRNAKRQHQRRRGVGRGDQHIERDPERDDRYDQTGAVNQARSVGRSPDGDRPYRNAEKRGYAA